MNLCRSQRESLRLPFWRTPNLKLRRIAAFCRPAVAGLALLGLAACTVADYQQPIGEMAGRVSETITSINQLDTELTALRDVEWRQKIIDGELLLDTLGDSCSLEVSNCALGVRARGEEIEKPFPPESMIPKAKAGLDGLKSYVENLQAIVDAKTADNVAGSANAALGSAMTIETAIGEVAGSETNIAGTFRKPVVNGVRWLAGQYVLYTKVKALKNATAKAQPVIMQLARFYEDIAEAASLVKLGQEHKAFVAAQEVYDDLDVPNKQQINAYVAAAEKYDRVLRAIHARPLQAFADAHYRLYSQLHGRATLPQAVSALEIFALRVEEFKQIVGEFDEAIHSE